jgi:hypothetical protein
MCPHLRSCFKLLFLNKFLSRDAWWGLPVQCDIRTSTTGTAEKNTVLYVKSETFGFGIPIGYCGRIERRTSSGVRPSPLHDTNYETPAPGPTFPNAFILRAHPVLPLVEAQHVDDPRSRDAPSTRQRVNSCIYSERHDPIPHGSAVSSRRDANPTALLPVVSSRRLTRASVLSAQSPPNSRYSYSKYLL